MAKSGSSLLKVLVVFVCIPVAAPAQEESYQFSDTILAKLAQDRSPLQIQISAWYLSYIGEYKKALETWDMGAYAEFALPEQSQEYFKEFKPVPALSYILERAKRERIIIINEKHHQPSHRVFVEGLLDSLYSYGYRYFGAETFSKKDTMLNIRKYPVIKTGSNSMEPEFGNLIRTALQDGYYLFPYESDGHGPVEREPGEAKNIKAFLDAHPDAKVIIYCGYAHLYEGDYLDWGKPMAGRLKEYTGIDPLTIDQVQLTESSTIEYDDPWYKNIDLDHYAVFIDSAGLPFHGPPNGDNQYDIGVYHPRTRWVEGRPHWVFENGRHPYMVNDKVTGSFPCLVFAYYPDEDISKAVPTDIIELGSKEDRKALALKKGKYVVLIKDTNGKEQRLDVEL